jgi:hypothetical protein
VRSPESTTLREERITFATWKPPSLTHRLAHRINDRKYALFRPLIEPTQFGCYISQYGYDASRGKSV